MRIPRLIVVALIFLGGSRAVCAPVAFTDEAAYLNAINLLPAQTVFEGFEDDAAWGDVRSTIVGGTHTAPAVTSHGMVWSANNDVSQVTTGPGAARTGDWGFYELPHGEYANGIGDGFRVSSPIDLYGVGGWVRTNTPFAEVNFVLDGSTVVDFGDPVIGTQPRFFGVVESLGFHELEVREIEGAAEDQKFIFADDFTIARAVLPGDYNADDSVNAADYVVWRRHRDESFVLLGEDPAATTPGVVDEEDYDFWRAHFGNTVGNSSSAAGTIAEPATTLVLLIGALPFAHRLKRRQVAQ
jgi:hypothetical protein